jgi:hypothetical protein
MLKPARSHPSRRAYSARARVGDAVDGGGVRRDRDARIEAAHPLEHVALGRDLDEGQLDDPVVLHVEPRGLQVEEDQRSFEREG